MTAALVTWRRALATAARNAKSRPGRAIVLAVTPDVADDVQALRSSVPDGRGVFVRSFARTGDQLLAARVRVVRAAAREFVVDEIIVVRHSAGDTVQRRIELPSSLRSLRFVSREAAEQAALDALELGWPAECRLR